MDHLTFIKYSIYAFLVFSLSMSIVLGGCITVIEAMNSIMKRNQRNKLTTVVITISIIFSFILSLYITVGGLSLIAVV